jgi:hypothetical protein
MDDDEHDEEDGELSKVTLRIERRLFQSARLK